MRAIGRQGTGRAAALVAGVIGAAGIVVALLLFGSGPAIGAPTCTLNFTNVAGGDYFTAANWSDAITPSTHRVPTTSDYVCVPANVTGLVTFSTGASSTVTGIGVSDAAGFKVSSGTLTLTDTANASAIKDFTLAGGTVTGAANLTVSGTSTWSGGTQSGTGATTIAPATAMNVTSAFLARPATNHGTITVTASGITFLNTAVLTNAANGTIDMQGDNLFLGTNAGANGSITNSGLVERTSGTGTDIIKVPITTSLAGLKLAAGTGTVSLTGGGTISGTGTIPATATLSFDVGTYTINSATFAGAGTTRMQSNSGVNWQTTGDNTISSALTFAGGTIGGAGNLTLSGPTTWSAGTFNGAGNLTINAGTALAFTGGNLGRPATNHGTITVTANGITFLNTAVLTNAANGTIDMQGDNLFLGTNAGANGSITNSGLVERTSGTGTDIIKVPITTSLAGLKLAAGTGTVSLTGGGTISGTGTIPATATLSFDVGTYTINSATFAGAGTTRMQSNSGVNWQTTGDNTISSALTFAGGTIGGAGNLTLSGPTTWSAGTFNGAGNLTINAGTALAFTGGNLGRPATNHGTITVTANGITFLNTAVLTNAANGTIDMQGDNLFLGTNAGANGSITNSGLVERSIGTGTDSVRVPITNTATGELRVVTGTLTAPTLTNFASNTLNGGVYTVTGTLQLNHIGGKIVTNAATIAMRGAASAIVDDLANDLLAPIASSSGSLSLTGGRSLSTSATSFTNSGVVKIGDGATASSFAVNGEYVQTTGTTAVALESTLTSASDASIQGGTLSGAGTVTVPVVNGASGAVQNADPAGPLTLANGYSGSGKVRTQISSATAFDTVHVVGTGTLSGSKLNLSTKASYAPAQGRTFTIVTCTTACSGHFASITGATMPDGAFYTVGYTGTAVTLTAIRNADVAVTNIDSSDPIPADAPAGPHSTLAYTVTVTNNGPAPANGVVVTDTLPHDAVLTSAPAGCNGAGDTQTCNVGTIAVGGNLVLNFVVRPSAPETLVNAVSSTAVAGSPDSSPANNTNVTQPTVVTPEPHTSYVVVDDGPGGVAYDPAQTAVKKLGDRVQFDFFGAASHRLQSTDGSIDTGIQAPGSEVAVAITGAGMYSFRDTLAAQVVTGTITAKPTISGTGSARTVVWSTVAVPAGYAFDVRVKTPTGVHPLLTGTTTTSTLYTADQGPGSYSFQVRLRRLSDNHATGYAKSKAFTI